MQDRRLAAAVKAQAMRRRIQQPDEGRDEAVGRERCRETVVDLHERALQRRAQLERHAQHRLHLGDRQRRRDPVTGGIRQHHEESGVVQRQIERVAAGELGGAERSADVVAGNHRHRRRQRAHLDFARHLERLPHLLAFDQRACHAHALQRDRALRGQCRRDGFVVLVEHARPSCSAPASRPRARPCDRSAAASACSACGSRCSCPRPDRSADRNSSPGR